MSRTLLSLAGFQVIITGRFWVIAEVNAPNAYISDENSETAGTKSRRTFRKVKTKFHTKRAVIRTVPTSASSAAFLSVMVGV